LRRSEIQKGKRTVPEVAMYSVTHRLYVAIATCPCFNGGDDVDDDDDEVIDAPTCDEPYGHFP
jgi:hypothetical protein